MVTTTSKLLNYYVHHKYLHWHSWDIADTTYIQIDSVANEVEGSYIPSNKQLEGITFYVPENQEILLYAGESLIPLVHNNKDETEEISVSVAWQSLTLPPGIFNSNLNPRTDSEN